MADLLTRDDLVNIFHSVWPHAQECDATCKANAKQAMEGILADAILARLRPGWDSLMESNLKWFEESKKAYAACDALRADLRACAEALKKFHDWITATVDAGYLEPVACINDVRAALARPGVQAGLKP